MEATKAKETAAKLMEASDQGDLEKFNELVKATGITPKMDVGETFDQVWFVKNAQPGGTSEEAAEILKEVEQLLLLKGK